MTMIVSPNLSTSRMLENQVGGRDSMFSSCVARTNNAVISRMDQQERVAISEENARLHRSRAKYNDSKCGDRVGGFSGGISTGLLVAAFTGPIMGIVVGILTAGGIGSTMEQTRLEQNRLACQEIAKGLVEIALERVKRLFEKEELIEEEIQRLETANRQLFPPQFSIWRPSSWQSNSSETRSLESQQEAQRLATRNTMDMNKLLKIQEHFRGIRCEYVRRFSEVVLRNMYCKLGEWEFHLSYRNKFVAIDVGKRVAA